MNDTADHAHVFEHRAVKKYVKMRAQFHACFKALQSMEVSDQLQAPADVLRRKIPPPVRN